jgi:small-conductance mechanosensitive channel
MLRVDIVETAVVDFLALIRDALPRVIAGIVFLVLAGALVKLLMTVVRAVLRRAFTEDEPVYRQFVATVVLVFLSFAVALSFLSIVGLEDLATSLGTATGFVALGVSYALSNMIADAVAGVYLLRDPDFNPGDTVNIGGTVAEVKTIELRKTRLRVPAEADPDGASADQGGPATDTLVRSNADIEKQWRKLDDE